MLVMLVMVMVVTVSWTTAIITPLNTETSPAPDWLTTGPGKAEILTTDYNTTLSVSQVHFASFSWQITVLTPPYSTGTVVLNNTENNFTMWRLRGNFLPLIPIFSCILTTFTQLFQSSHFGSGRGLGVRWGVWEGSQGNLLGETLIILNWLTWPCHNWTLP